MSESRHLSRPLPGLQEVVEMMCFKCIYLKRHFFHDSEGAEIVEGPLAANPHCLACGKGECMMGDEHDAKNYNQSDAYDA